MLEKSLTYHLQDSVNVTPQKTNHSIKNTSKSRKRSVQKAIGISVVNDVRIEYLRSPAYECVLQFRNHLDLALSHVQWPVS